MTTLSGDWGELVGEAHIEPINGQPRGPLKGLPVLCMCQLSRVSSSSPSTLKVHSTWDSAEWKSSCEASRQGCPFSPAHCTQALLALFRFWNKFRSDPTHKASALVVPLLSAHHTLPCSLLLFPAPSVSPSLPYPLNFLNKDSKHLLISLLEYKFHKRQTSSYLITVSKEPASKTIKWVENLVQMNIKRKANTASFPLLGDLQLCYIGTIPSVLFSIHIKSWSL